ncbi:MAG: tetratricopeptide repeat protein [Fimbriiglobus sp.]
MIRLPMPLALAVAVAAPTLLLHLMASEDRSEMGLTVAPFATPRLLIAHMLAALPFALIMRQRLGLSLHSGVQFAVMAGASLCALLFVPAISDILADGSASFGVRAIFRSLIALALVSAWLIWLWQPQASSPKPLAWLASVALAFIPPAVFAERQREGFAKEFPGHLQSQQFRKAQADLSAASDLGDALTSGKRTSADTRELLNKKIESLKVAVAKPVSPTASSQAKLERVMHYLSLSRPDDAEKILSTLSPDSVDVQLLRMAVMKERQDWAAMEQQAQAILSTSTDANLKSFATKNLMEALRKQGRWAEVEAMLKQLIESEPKEAGASYFQLALLAADRGKIHEALEHFDMAEKLDPSLIESIAVPRRRIKANSFSCFQR